MEIKLSKEPFKLKCKSKRCQNSGLVSTNKIVNFKKLD